MVPFALLEGTLALSCSGTKKVSDALWCGRPEPSLGEVAEIKCFLSESGLGKPDAMLTAVSHLGLCVNPGPRFALGNAVPEQ